MNAPGISLAVAQGNQIDETKHRSFRLLGRFETADGVWRAVAPWARTTPNEGVACTTNEEPTLSRIIDLCQLRKGHPLYDEELWDFIGEIHGNNLVYVSERGLQWRLAEIERNILFLDDQTTPRDDLRPERGWLSPWWWWRIRHWTLKELYRRGLIPISVVDIPPPPPLHPQFLGVVGGGKKLLARIARRDRILDTLSLGRLRFAPAGIYNNAKLNAARADEEMAKEYLRPGAALTMTGPKGEPIKPLGDVTFTTRRALYDGTQFVDQPYWFCSFSSDLDPRLFAEFPDPDGAESSCLLIFDPMEFVRRALPKLNQAVPHAIKSLFPNEYFDPYHPHEKLTVVRHKHFSYAYQREMRFMVDPEGGPSSGDALQKAFFIEIGSIEDIAAAYTPNGDRIAGTGPNSFLR